MERGREIGPNVICCLRRAGIATSADYVHYLVGRDGDRPVIAPQDAQAQNEGGLARGGPAFCLPSKRGHQSRERTETLPFLPTTLQNKPEVAFILVEPCLEGAEQRTGTAGHSRSAQQQQKPTSAQSTDLLGLPMEEELTQEEKQACGPHPMHASAALASSGQEDRCHAG